MLTPGRKSRRSILTPSRASATRLSSPAPALQKPQVLCETPQYQLVTMPYSIHAVARDAVKRRHITYSGLEENTCYVCEGNRAIVWSCGGDKMFELLAPNMVFSIHVTCGNGAVLVTVNGEVIRWSNMEQVQRYTVQHNVIPNMVVHTVLDADNASLLVLDSTYKVWRCDGTNTLTQLNPSSAFGGITRRVSNMFWASSETLLGAPRKLVSCGEVVMIVGETGLQRIYNNAITWTTALAPLLVGVLENRETENIVIVDAAYHNGTLKCLVRTQYDTLFLVTLDTQQPTPEPSTETIKIQLDDVTITRILLRENTDVGLLYSDHFTHVVTIVTGDTVPVVTDMMDILCVGYQASDIVMLTKKKGMLKLIVKDVMSAVSNLNLSAVDEDQGVEKLFWGAFKCFMDFNETENQAKLQDILDTEDTALINEIISATGRYLLTASPAADPRWRGDDANLPVTIGLQVDERLKRLKSLLQFVIVTGYYGNLTTESNNIAIVLLQYVEKCLVAKALLSSSSALLRRAIGETAAHMKTANNSELSSEDLLFSNINKIDAIFKVLAQGQNSAMCAKDAGDTVVQELFSSVEAVQQVFDSVLAWRTESERLYQGALKENMVTWTDTDEIRTILTAQFHIATETVLPDVNEEGRYQVLLVSASLAESVLRLYQDVLLRMSPQDNATASLQAEYERRRQALTEPFVKLKIYQIAFSLADQFKHFTLLVELCESTNDMAKLRAFSARHPGFAEVAYNWYLTEGKQARLLTANVADPRQLSDFLTSHEHLKWIHQIGNKEFTTAAETLIKLGVEENKLLSRKKTLLSISKLSLLADGHSPDSSQQINQINRELDIITYQERMKPDIIENAGLDPDNLAPLSIPDLIRLCIGDYNPVLEDLDVKKALDLLQRLAEDESVSDTEFEQLRLDVWVSVIRNDEWWTKCHMATPDQIDQTLFYRAVILAYNSGLLISHFLPKVEVLVAHEQWRTHFPDAAHFKQFEYIIRSGYEQMTTMGVMCH